VNYDIFTTESHKVYQDKWENGFHESLIQPPTLAMLTNKQSDAILDSQ